MVDESDILNFLTLSIIYGAILLGVWKFFEIIIWVITHIRITIQ